MLIGLLAGDSLQEDSLITNLVMSALFVLTPLVGGGYMIRSHVKQKQLSLKAKQAALYQRREKQVLRLAQQHGGRLSVPEIAVNTSMSTDQAEAFMEELTRKGYVDIQVTGSGAIVYEFYGMSDGKSLDNGNF